MANSLSNWQDSLNDGLVNRLTRPLRQPGMMKMAMSQRIINRCDRFLNRLPLLTQQMQRWGNPNTLSSDSVPLVYAQPVSSTKQQGIDNKVPNFQQPVFENNDSVPIIQRKLDITQSLPITTFNNTIPVQNTTDLSTSNVSDEITQFLTLEKQINPTDSLASEIPVVSPQSITEELPKTSSMPLQAKFPDSLTSSPISQSNLNQSYQPILEEMTTINPSAIASSEIPVVSSQPITPAVAKTLSMPLQAKFTDSPTSSDISQSNLNQPSQPILEQITTINPSAIASSKIPVVSPQPVAEELPKTAEIPLLQEFANIPDQPVPIIQAKLQDYSRSQFFLPLVNDLNTLVYPKQTPQNKSSENASSIKQPASIVNTQPVNLSISQINQTSPLAIVSVTSLTTPSSKAQSLPLPLAKTTLSSRSINQQPNLSSNNSISNTDSASSTRTFTSPLSLKETSVSPVATQPHIDVDTIANQVERKLMRRLVIESERRGKNQWR
ncbi:MAG TPA: hypothetical protein V6D15_18495 [Oculatellaceae cyanobacterium]|jgi:hypothetical protein